MMHQFSLPYPAYLSINRLYRKSKTGVFLSKKAWEYREIVYFSIYQFKKFYDEKIKLEIKVHHPDKRKRDLDNILKAVIDSLQYAKLFNDDYQIKNLHILEMPVLTDGKLEITISSLP